MIKKVRGRGLLNAIIVEPKDGKEAWDAYIWVENADKLYDEFMKKEVSIIKHIQNH